MSVLVASLDPRPLVWLVALIVFMRLLAREAVEVGARERRAVFAAFLGALAGSKLLAIANRPVQVLGAADLPEAWLMLMGGDSVLGALLGARFALWCALPGDQGAVLADRLIRPTGYALFTLYCGSVLWAIQAGDAGGPTPMPWGVDFGDGVSRHPVMLYQALVMLGVLLFDRMLAATVPPPGLRASCFVALTALALACLAAFKAPFHVPLLVEWVSPRPHLYLRLATAEQWAGLFAGLAALPKLVAGLMRVRETT